MRLIDADKVLERLKKWNTSDETDRALYNFVIIRIFEQPVVYDVEKSCRGTERMVYECRYKISRRNI